VIQLNKNESYWLLDEPLVAAAQSSSSEALSTYPSYEALRESLALYAGVTPEMVLITPGSDVGIENIVKVYGNTEKNVLLPVPTFYGYESILDRAGLETTPIFYTERDGNFIFPYEETIAALPGAGILFLCNPNNPLGTLIPEDMLVHILENAQTHNVRVVSDEAYFEFSNQTLLPFLKKYQNLLIVRTLSKGFGLSGARLGYVLGSPKDINQLAARMLPWPVAHTSVFAALALLARVDAVQKRIEVVKEERIHFRDALAALPGVMVYPSEANFVLVRVPNASEAMQAFANAGIQVALGSAMSRFPDAQKLLAETLRIAVPSPEDELEVVAILKSLLTD